MTTTDQYEPTAGEKCRVVFPLHNEVEVDADTIAADAHKQLSKLCQEHGFVAQDVTLVSADPWTEEVGGIGPMDDMVLYVYEATVA